MSLDRILDASFQCMLIAMCAGVTFLTPFWVWFVFRIYVPKNKQLAMKGEQR